MERVYMSTDQSQATDSQPAQAEQQQAQQQQAQFTPEQMAQIQQMFSQQQQPTNQQPTFSEYRQQAEPERQQQAQQQQAQQAQIEKSAQIQASFDQTLESNYFPDSVRTIKADIEKTSSDLNLVDKTNLQLATAGKEFFQGENNLNIESLDPISRQQVQTEILSKRFENEIDGFKAWELVQRAIYVRDQLAVKNGDVAQLGGSGSKELDEKLKSFFPSHVVTNQKKDI